MWNTWLTRTLNIDLPILGAPMGGRAGGELAGQVTAAGGLGMIGAARYATAEWIDEQLRVIRAAAGEDAPLAFGLQTWSLADSPELLDSVLAARPKLVSLSFGDPAPFVQRVKDAGAVVISQINSLEDLREVEAAGVDAVVAQGGEAGGHTGRIATLPLLQEVLRATDLPVLAAGGIGSGAGLAAVLAAGAQGALIGTALLASPETVGPEYAIPALLKARSEDTVYTDVFDKARHQPWPENRWFGRALTNDFTARWHDGDGVDASSGSEEAVSAAYDGAIPEIGVVYAGQAAGLVDEVRPAREVVASIAADAESRLRAVAEVLG
ncbi:NAD(P)H-dependent flavin oxidoreductase [Tsukamurella spumae]|uniref:Nitronate monooxygenase n=1 Tax=Tsukamurella spumae TaxID=44753 RepID=A0A846X4Y2_9ACTN|nr:nitronate monooxygenase [Tsukamurella spumae]NKY19242.1 nitronate monooxygenase [Tsukamurella spumae]